VLVADHHVPAKDVRTATVQARMADWAREQGVVFYDQGRGGIEHALLAEEGWLLPGAVVVGGDSHTCSAGALGSLGLGLGATDVAWSMASGETWLEVPETLRVTLAGRLGPWVTGKDIILAVLDRLGVGGGRGTLLEFAGDGAAALTVDERLAVANMAVETGADGALFAPDATIERYLAERSPRYEVAAPVLDSNAAVRGELELDLDALEPLVALPNSPGAVVGVRAAAGVSVDQVYIGNCANGTITDLRQAASVWRGRTLHPRTRAVVVPATQAVYRQAAAEGLLEIFAAAGAMVAPPTCGACFGGHMGVLAPGETAVATINRNFRGRMGSPDSSVYLAGALVAAASGVAGEIVHPSEVAG
jgi:3-isopropylmalate/(R)-2-methylmalate dehydratase large subunit